MKRTLIVEDDDNKAEQLVQFAHELSQMVLRERSLRSGLKALRSMPWDLVLLDMTLPNFDPGPDEPGGGTVHGFGGRKFLRQMDRFDLTCPVIVVTQFESFRNLDSHLFLDELDAELRTEFPKFYRGCVYYHASSSDWRSSLLRLADEVSKGHLD